MDSFKLVAEAKVNGTIPIYKYVSKRTGLKVVLALVEGPVVNGYFTLGNLCLFGSRGHILNLIKPIAILVIGALCLLRMYNGEA